MRMRVLQDGDVSPVLAEHVQDFVGIAALLAAGVQFAVRVGSRTSLAETVVALAVHLMLTRDFRKVELTVAHVLSALHDDGTTTGLYQAQGGKQSARPGTDHNHLRRMLHITVLRAHELIAFRHFVHVHTHFQIDVYRALAGIDTAFQHPDCHQRTFVHAFLTGDIASQRPLVGRHFRQYSQLVFLCHVVLY